jgi:hypothetical protein
MKNGFSRIADIILAVAFVITVLLLIVPPYGIMAGFSEDTVYVFAALFAEVTAGAVITLVRMHRQASAEYAAICKSVRF